MRSDETCRRLLEAIEALPLGETQIMEVCGTHTMAIAEAGIRSLLPQHIRLISGPGCPVCVTPPEDIDAVLDLAMERDVVLTSYGDMLRVPGSRRGDSLLRRRAAGRGCADRLFPGGCGGDRRPGTGKTDHLSRSRV